MIWPATKPKGWAWQNRPLGAVGFYSAREKIFIDKRINGLIFHKRPGESDGEGKLIYLADDSKDHLKKYLKAVDKRFVGTNEQKDNCGDNSDRYDDRIVKVS